MGFRKRLRLATADWSSQCIEYKALKKVLGLMCTDPVVNARVEGEFLSQLLSSIHQVNTFYMSKEAEQMQLLGKLAPVLFKPELWMMCPLEQAPPGSTLENLVPMLIPNGHAPRDQVEALHTFVLLCREMDMLRKFSVLNYMAVMKIVKKHDNASNVHLSDGIRHFVNSQQFYTTQLLGDIFHKAQSISKETLAVMTRKRLTDPSVHLTCSTCSKSLSMPVALPCGHQFCYGCIARTVCYNRQCPTCDREQANGSLDLDTMLSEIADDLYSDNRDNRAVVPAQLCTRAGQQKRPLEEHHAHHATGHLDPHYQQQQEQQLRQQQQVQQWREQQQAHQSPQRRPQLQS